MARRGKNTKAKHQDKTNLVTTRAAEPAKERKTVMTASTPVWPLRKLSTIWGRRAAAAMGIVDMTIFDLVHPCAHKMHSVTS